ncbi:MAG: RHS repeat-associated core domain-containing protein, partial [Tyzzerella sp.]|nr:RHS repeat-associated core domain-containing protein [Tyzzerella sp.]
TTDCEETVANRFRYLGEQHDPITQQYYLRARYYNPVIGRFTQEDTYYGDGLNLYQYCAGNPVRYCDPSGHGSVEQNPYKRYTDVGADADTAALAGQAYPDASSKQSLYNKYRNMGYSAENALMLANHEIIHGTASTEGYAKNVPKTGTDRTQTSPRDNYSTDWRSQNRANQQRGDGGSNTLPDPYAQLRERGIPQTLTDAEINAANQAGLRMMAGESGTPSVIYGTDDIASYQYNMIENPGPLAEMPNQPAKNFYGGRYNMEVLQEDRIMYRAGNAENPYGRWFTSEPPASVANVRIDTAVKTHWIDPKTGACEASSYIDNVYAIKVPKGTTVYTGPVGPQGGAYVGGYNVMQTYIDAPWTFEVIGKTPLQ